VRLLSAAALRPVCTRGHSRPPHPTVTHSERFLGGLSVRRGCQRWRRHAAASEHVACCRRAPPRWPPRWISVVWGRWGNSVDNPKQALKRAAAGLTVSTPRHQPTGILVCHRPTRGVSRSAIRVGRPAYVRSSGWSPAGTSGGGRRVRCRHADGTARRSPRRVARLPCGGSARRPPQPAVNAICDALAATAAPAAKPPLAAAGSSHREGAAAGGGWDGTASRWRPRGFRGKKDGGDVGDLSVRWGGGGLVGRGRQQLRRPGGAECRAAPAAEGKSDCEQTGTCEVPCRRNVLAWLTTRRRRAARSSRTRPRPTSAAGEGGGGDSLVCDSPCFSAAERSARSGLLPLAGNGTPIVSSGAPGQTPSAPWQGGERHRVGARRRGRLVRGWAWRCTTPGASSWFVSRAPPT